MFTATNTSSFFNLNSFQFKIILSAYAITLLTNFPSPVFCQSRVPDSLKSVLNQHAQEDTLKVGMLNQLSDQYKWVDFYASQKYAEQSLKLARELHFEKGIATADYRLAHCYWGLGDNDLAIERALEGAEIAGRNNLKSILGECYTILARAYIDQIGFDKAKEYLAPAEKIALQTGNRDLLSRVYNLMGVLLLVKESNDSALNLYMKTLDIMKSEPSTKSFSSVINLNIGECYLSLLKPELALKNFQEALSISKEVETRNKYTEAIASSKIGLVLVTKHDYKAAEQYLLEGLKLSKHLGSKRALRYPYAGLLELKTQQGKASEALDYYRKYYALDDSIINVHKMRQIVELENKYRVELLERDKKIQQLWTNILIAALIFISVLAVTVYYFLLFRERKNRKILNLQIDSLTNQHEELSKKYKGLVVDEISKPMESIDQRLLRKAIEVVENNISDSLFSVDQMAKEIGMSRTNLYRKVKSITGFGPKDLIRNIRLRKAAALLLHQAETVSQIGFKVGFEDHSYFSKSFKKQFGVPPSEYLEFVKRSQN